MKHKNYQGIEFGNVVKTPITKEMLEEVREQAQIGEIVRLQSNDTTITENKIFKDWTIVQKYTNYMLIEREAALGIIRRALSYVDYYKILKGESV